MSEFRNAYHFVPRRQPIPETLFRLPETQKEFGLTPETAALGHAIYAEGTHSGRIRCRVTLESPIVIGAVRHRQPNNHSIVEPFLFKGMPAVPATSIKGVISSVAEAASLAPFRVLENMNLTVRPAGKYNHQTKQFELASRISSGNPGVSMGRTHDYFPGESLPSSMSRRDIHLVESMFGFVRMEGADGERPGKTGIVAVAGKLRFSHALPAGDFAGQSMSSLFLQGDYLPSAGAFENGMKLSRLKEQAQPMKAPPNNANLRSATPNFYFRRKSNPEAYIGKADFGSKPARDFDPQGGKFYLHSPEARTGEPWKTADTRRGTSDLERKTAAAPIKAGTQFEFSVDFDNLTMRELELLCFALRPSPQFRHKIGLGKALGLGSIRIDILECAVVDRQSRYAVESVFSQDPRASGSSGGGFDAATASNNHILWLTARDPAALNALMAIGETHVFGEANKDAQIPVLWVPLTEAKFASRDKPGAEDKSFDWFMENDKKGKQKLQPISRRNFVPTLDTESTPNRGGVEARGASQPGSTSTQNTKPDGGGIVLTEGERMGTLKFFKPGKDGLLFGFVIPDGGGPEIHIGSDPGQKAGLNRVPPNTRIRVVFSVKLDADGRPTVKEIRKI